MDISPATVDDAAALLDLQRLAYQTEAELYDDYSIAPLVETLDDLRDQFRFKCFLKAVEDGRIVGSVRAVEEEDACHVQRLIVHPDYRRRGIATALLQRIEAAHPAAARFELFTGHRSANNLRLYLRHGFRPFRQETINEKLTMVFLEKSAVG